MARDGGKCVVCGAPGVNAHHILSAAYFPALYRDIDNGVLLCRKCHLWAHRGMFSNPSKRKYPASVAIERLMERASSPSVRPLVERLVYGGEANLEAADKYRGEA